MFAIIEDRISISTYGEADKISQDTRHDDWRTQSRPTVRALVWRKGAMMGVSFDHSLELAAVPAFMDSMYLMFAAVRCRAALRPDTRPKTTQSRSELPPRRLLP